MYEQFGVSRRQDGRYQFQLFVPDRGIDPRQYDRGGDCRIVEVRIVGDFQKRLGAATDWSYDAGLVMEEGQHPNGRLWRYALPAGFADGYYQYKYVVRFRNGSVRWMGDPCTKYGGGQEDNSAFIIGGAVVPMEPLRERLPWQDLIIYELMIDDFTKEYRAGRAPIDAVLDKLDYLIELGFNAIEFMPWIAWPDEGTRQPFSWGYDPAYYFSVEAGYVHVPNEPLDKLSRLNRLINACHQRGIHVLMDIVLQHAKSGPTDGGFAYYWLWQQPEESPFVGNFTDANPFGSKPLDYNNWCTQQFAQDVCTYWMDRFGIDGLRFDETSGFFRRDRMDRGMPGIIKALEVHETGAGRKSFAMILEDFWDFRAIDDTNVMDGSACWFDMIRARAFDYLGPGGRVDTRIMRVLNAGLDFREGKGPVMYVENHDHSTITYKAGGDHGREVWYRAQPYMIALYTCPGAVMIHNGQEFGQVEMLLEDDSGQPPALARVQSRPLRWEESTDAVGTMIRDRYRRLAKIRREHPGLRTMNFYPSFYDEQWTRFGPEGYGVDTDKQVVIYHRWGPGSEGRLERFIVVVNFSGEDQWVDVPFSKNGVWRDVLNGGEVDVQGWWMRNYRVPSNWGSVYWQEG